MRASFRPSARNYLTGNEESRGNLSLRPLYHSGKCYDARPDPKHRERDDAQLMSMYEDEAALKAAHQQQLDSIDQEIKAAQFSLRGQEQALADLLDRAAAAERSGKNLPDAQTQRIAELRAQIETHQEAVERRQADRESTQARLEAEVLHFRELKAKRDAEHSSP